MSAMQRDRHGNDPEEEQSLAVSSTGTGRGDTDRDQSGLGHGEGERVHSTQRREFTVYIQLRLTFRQETEMT